MGFQKRVVRLVCFLALICSTPCLASPFASVPLDSRVYPGLDKLAGLGLIDDSLQGSRLYTRSEAAPQTMDAREKLDSASAPTVGELLRRLETEFGIELRATRKNGDFLVGFTPTLEARLAWIFREGEDARYSNTPAHQSPLNTYNFGLEYFEEDRVVPEPCFGGMRIDSQPLSWFELGASRAAMFGGEGRPAVHFEDFLTSSGARTSADRPRATRLPHSTPG